MGLDISVNFDLNDEFHSKKFESDLGIEYWFNLHALSRLFCNFMCRKDVIEGKTELVQLGELTKVNINPILNMEGFMSDFDIEEWIEVGVEKEDPEIIRQKAKEENKKFENNIDLSINTIETLIEKLSKIENLDSKIDFNEYDTLGKEYFQNFNIENKDSYVNNNLGQDLRNLLRSVKFGKSHGAKTVYFNYG